MAEFVTIQDSIRDLYLFEYLAFKKTFSQAFILLGAGYLVLIFMSIFSLEYHISIVTSSFLSIEVLSYLGISIYLALKITSLRKSSYENVSLFKKKSLIGWTLILICGIFNIIEQIMLPANIIYSFIGGYFYLYVLFFIYYLNGRLFFPKEKNKFLKNFSIVAIIIMMIHLLFWLIISQFIPGFFSGSRSILNYGRFNSIITGLLLLLFGMIIHKEGKSLGWEIHE